MSKNQFRKRQRQKLYLDESLRNLALVLLSPLLAISTWFLLVQVGLQDDQNGANGQSGVFILAVVSFSVGLVTNEIVQYLINFVKNRFEPSTLTPKSLGDEKVRLSIKSQVAKKSVSSTEDQYIITFVKDYSGNNIINAKVKRTIFYNSPEGEQEVEKFIHQTDVTGEMVYRIRKKLEPGSYNVLLHVSAENYDDGYSFVIFDAK